MKMKVRPIYSELQGMLSQAPDRNHTMYREEDRIWKRLNELVNNLKEVTSDDSYEAFRIVPHDALSDDSDYYVSALEYRSSLSGLISRLHGTYFETETAPFSGTPGIAVTQTQSVSVEVILQLGSDLQKALDTAETPEEKGFIQSIKDKVITVKSYVDFLLLVSGMAQQYGITLDQIKHLFGS